MTHEEMVTIARGNIEANLGNVCTGDDDADTIYDEAYTLGFDALADVGVPHALARIIAAKEAQCFAQP